MKIALVHDYLNQYGGAERVLEALLEIYPDADLFTLIYDSRQMPAKLSKKRIRRSFLNKFPFSKFYYEYLLPLYPLAIESFDMRGYDLIISNSSAWAKGIITTVNSCHITYCLNPMRFAYDSYYPLINKKGIISKGLAAVLHYIRLWDEISAKRPDKYITISETVKRRVIKYYGIDSEIVHPPVDNDFFVPAPDKRQEQYYLIVSRLKPYKQIELAIEAFNFLKKPLIIIGDGSHYNYLKGMAKRNIQFIRDADDLKLLSYYQRCKAVIFPQIEDFGIVPLEAQACGKPVIAFKGGGAVETVIDGKTGILFSPQTAHSLINAIEKFETLKFDSKEIRDHAKQFSKDIFKLKFSQKIEAFYANYKKEMNI